MHVQFWDILIGSMLGQLIYPSLQKFALRLVHGKKKPEPKDGPLDVWECSMSNCGFSVEAPTPAVLMAIRNGHLLDHRK